MKKTFITSVIGPVTPGIIKSLAQVTRTLGGEWLSSKVIKLDGQFSALMKVAVDEGGEVILKSTLEEQFSGLTFFYADALHAEHAPSKIVSLVVDCNDRPGLTRDIDEILSNLDLEVEHMEFNRVHVSSIGKTVFSSKLAIALPDNISCDSVVELLEGLSDDVRVNVIT